MSAHNAMGEYVECNCDWIEGPHDIAEDPPERAMGFPLIVPTLSREELTTLDLWT